jgi:hypothetical protein
MTSRLLVRSSMSTEGSRFGMVWESVVENSYRSRARATTDALICRQGAGTFSHYGR